MTTAFKSIIKEHFHEESGIYRLFIELPVELEDSYELGQVVSVTIDE